MGVFPRYRYVIFTERLLDELPPECVEAILAHEIGHSYHRHALRYFLILTGALVLLALGEIYGKRALESYAPEGKGRAIVSLGAVILLLGLYFRVVWGYFSRLFERQADLHVFELGIPPEAMIEALDRVGIAAGFIHHQPSWHHYSIAERIAFLETVKQQPELVKKHHQKARRHFWIYLAFLLLALTAVAASI